MSTLPGRSRGPGTEMCFLWCGTRHFLGSLNNRGILAFVAYFQDFYEVQPCSLGLLPQILASFAVVMCGVGGCKMTHNGNVAGG